MTTCNPGDVVEVPFPFVVRPVKKRRPALVLSDREFAEETGVIVLTMITSAKRSSWKSDIALMEWSAAGLRAPSVVRWKVFSIDSTLILNRRGCLSSVDMNAVAEGFQSRFGAWA